MGHILGLAASGRQKWELEEACLWPASGDWGQCSLGLVQIGAQLEFSAEDSVCAQESAPIGGRRQGQAQTQTQTRGGAQLSRRSGNGNYSPSFCNFAPHSLAQVGPHNWAPLLPLPLSLGDL